MGPDLSSQPDPIDDAHWERLDAYFADRLSLAERVEMDRWVIEREDRRRMVMGMREVWERAASATPQIGAIDIRQVLNALAARRDDLDIQEQLPARITALTDRRPGAGTARRYRRTEQAWRIAAVVVAAVGLAAEISWLAVREYRARRPVSTLAALPTREVVTRRGERATLDLADGTRVVLAPESRLRIPATFHGGTGLGSRELDLEGEAYFEVRHDAAHPFRVHTTLGIAEDLGTEFVVTAYPDTRGLRVVVVSGEVALQRTPQATVVSDTLRSRPLAVLVSNDLAQLDSLGIVNVRRGVNARRYTAWTAGHLVFDYTPLRDALPILQRWYDVEFRLGDPALAAQLLTATFDGESVQDVVRLLETLLNVRAEWRGRTVTLVARPGSAANTRSALSSHD